MSKQIKTVASGIAALGRGEDKMLVHMTPREVEGLQALAVSTGGSLTINPKTGLPEAGWLSSLLPMIAGAAATYFSGGTLAPWAAALWGAGAGAAGAKIEGEDPMMGALGGALGGVGGSGLTSGLTGVGRAGEIVAGTGTVLKDAGTAAAQQAATQNVVGAGTVLNNAGTTAQTAVNPSFVQSPALNTINNAQQTAMPAVSTMGQKEALNTGIRSLANSGVAENVWKGLEPLEKLGVTATGLGALDAASQSSGGGGGKGKKPYYYHTSATFDPNGYVSYGPGYWSKDYNYETLGTYNPYSDNKYAVKKAEGGEVAPRATDPIQPPPPVANPNPNQQYMANLQQLIRVPPPMPPVPYQQTTPASGNARFSQMLNTAMDKKGKKGKKLSSLQTALSAEEPLPPMQHFTFNPVTGVYTKLARGGITSLPEAGSVPTAGRFVRGPGDGASDSIPAVIDGQQPAALSNNEFVIDAMTMAKLGNGSPEAGAQKMYQWQQRVHSMPTAPGKNLKAERYLPV